MTQLQDLSTALAGLVASSAPSVIAVQSHRSRSSGFVWRPGLIVTADEALSEDGEFAVTLSGGDTVPAQLVGRDPTTDVALLRLDRSDLRPVPLEAAPVPVGALAIAIAPCVAARSTRGSSLICACGGVPKVVSPSTQPAGRSA